jgi:hypothetical protein
MKKLLQTFGKVSLIMCFFSIMLTSCAIHNGLTSNYNEHSTQVVLSQKNYKVIAKVEGSTSSIAVLGFGGSFRPLVEKARAKMLKNVDFIGSSRAVINETVEVNNKSFVGIVNMKTVTVSAYVIEFE